MIRKAASVTTNLFLLLLCALPAGAELLLSIDDGDTVTVARANQRLRVRLACIDAPETSQTPDGVAARRALQQLLPPGTELRLRIKAKDRYGRTVAEQFRGSTNINQALVCPATIRSLRKNQVRSRVSPS